MYRMDGEAAPADKGGEEAGAGSGADDSGGDGAGEGEGEFQLPEKFQGKSAEEVAKSYVELEKSLSKKGVSPEELGSIKSELKSITDYIRSAPGRSENEGDKGEGGEDKEYQQKQKDYFKSMGFLTKEELATEREEFGKSIKFEQRLDTLEKAYDGKDGRPKFDRQAIAQYAEANEMWVDPETVYKAMNEKVLIEWHIKQALEKGHGPHVKEPGKGGVQLPKGKKIEEMTPDERRQYLIDKTTASMEG